MATKKKAKTPAAEPLHKPANKLNGKAISARASGTAEARDTARLLLEIEAIHCRPDNPYIFTSGRASPVYIDCRKLISYPEARAKIMSHALKAIDREIGWSKIDVVAGGETAGIPFAAFLAALAKKPMIYVRKQPKGFGRMAQIEGDLKPGKRVLLVEDLATDGGSKLVFIEALKKAEAKVDRLLRDLPLRHLPAERGDAGRGRRQAARARHLVGRAGGGGKAQVLRREAASPRRAPSSRRPSNGRPTTAAAHRRRGRCWGGDSAK